MLAAMRAALLAHGSREPRDEQADRRHRSRPRRASGRAQAAAERATRGDAATPPPPRALVQAELARICASAEFKRSLRHQHLLRYLVGQVLAGDTAALKESVIAVEVLRRAPDRFDASRDSIVRVEARRLRQRLRRYYEEGEGRTAPLRIGLPVGSYVPTLRRQGPGRHAAAPAAAASPAVRELVERGMHFLREGGEASLRKAIERFDAAQREDPDHAPAYLGAARAWMNLVAEVLVPPLPWVDHAAEALERALALEPDNAEALTLQGATLHRYHFDWPRAERCFQRAIALALGLAFAHLGYGAHLGLAGRPDEAEVKLKLARELDPHYLNARWQMALLRVGQRRYAEARAEVEALLDLAPAHLPALHLIGAIALFTGRPEEALAQYRQVDAQAPAHPIGLVGIAQALAVLGDEAGVQRSLARLHERFGGRYVSPYQLALIELRRGHAEAALQWLDEGAATRDSSIIYALTDPALDALRGDARFAAFLARHRLA